MGQLKLLLSFRMYFKKYAFMLFLFILITVLVTAYSGLVRNMELSYVYHETSVIKGDCRLDLAIYDYDLVAGAFEDAVRENGGRVTSSHAVLPTIKIYAEDKNSKRVYLDLVQCDSLSGREIIVFSQYLPDKDAVFHDAASLSTLDVSLIQDDERGVELGLNIYEAMCSGDVYSYVTSRSSSRGSTAYYGKIDFTLEGDVDFEGVIKTFVRNRDIRKAVEESKESAAVIQMSLTDNYTTKQSYMRKVYSYNFRSGNIWEGWESLYRKFSRELMNEIDRFKLPIYILDRFIGILKVMTVTATIFISLSVFLLRKDEFTIYRSMGMSKGKLTFLLFLEELIMVVFVAAVSFLVLLLISFLLDYVRPPGENLVKNENIYFRDLLTRYGKYSIEGAGPAYLENILMLSVFFLGFSFPMNFVLLSFKERKEKRV